VPTLVVHEMLSRSTPILLMRPGYGGCAGNAQSVRSVRACCAVRLGAGTLRHFGAPAGSKISSCASTNARRAIAAGSDPRISSSFGILAARKMALLVPRSVRSKRSRATRRGAQLLHADSLGFLAAGKVADLVCSTVTLPATSRPRAISEWS